MTHTSDEQLEAGIGPFGRVAGNVYMALFLLAPPALIVVFVSYFVMYR